jgi:cobaltochelatase CobS
MAASALGREYGYASLNPQTPESRLLGFIDAGGTYRRTVFRDRFENGGIMCIDEMDNGHPALLNTLNGMIEPGAEYGAFPDGMVRRHPDFVMVCTGNTNGRGGDKMFPERRQLDAAFAERFAFLRWDYDLALERRLTLAHCEDSTKAETWLRWVRAVRAHVEKHSIRLWATPRAAMTGASFLHDSSWSVQDIAETVMFKGLDKDTVAAILTAVPYPTFAPANADVDPEDQ